MSRSFTQIGIEKQLKIIGAQLELRCLVLGDLNLLISYFCDDEHVSSFQIDLFDRYKFTGPNKIVHFFLSNVFI